MVYPRVRGLSLVHISLQALLAILLFWSWLAVHFYAFGRETPFFTNYLLYTGLVALTFVGDLIRANLASENVLELDLLRTHQLSSRQVAHIMVVLLLYLVAAKDHAISRLFLFSFIPPLYGLLYFSNRYLPGLLAQIFFNGRRAQRTLLVGAPADLYPLTYWLQRKSMYGMQVLGVVLHEEDDSVQARQQIAALGWSVLGRFSELRSLIEEQRANLVLATSGSDFPALAQFNDLCENAGARLVLLRDLQREAGRPVQVFRDDGMHVITLRQEPLECPLNRVIKRTIDVAVSLPVVLFLLPWTSLLVAFMQRRQSPGPLFFRQRRTGLHNETFNIYKYRTMDVDHGREADQATAGDSRIFPFGRWLRRTSLDELPQFINVLKGDMSIVGPRPHFFEHDLQFSQLAQFYRVRSFIKPGITGLAQVRGFRGEARTEAALQARVQCDLDYVENWTPALDWLIIFRTAVQIFRPPHSAY